jgi:hypothetical protein
VEVLGAEDLFAYAEKYSLTLDPNYKDAINKYFTQLEDRKKENGNLLSLRKTNICVQKKLSIYSQNVYFMIMFYFIIISMKEFCLKRLCSIHILKTLLIEKESFDYFLLNLNFIYSNLNS